jgi:uncharacterized protein YacL
MLKGFSLRAFSATTFGLCLGTVAALLIDHSGLFEHADENTRWLIRLSLFLGFGYIGMVLAMRSNKEDFSLIIPYVRFAPQHKPDNLLLLDTSVIIDGRIADLLESKVLEGWWWCPVLCSMSFSSSAIPPTPSAAPAAEGAWKCSTASSATFADGGENPRRRFPGREGSGRQAGPAGAQPGREIIHQRFNLGKIAALQSVICVNIHEVAKAFKTVLLPGENLHLRITREGKDKGQGVGYLADGTMVVVNQGQSLIGQQVEVQVQSLLQTGAGVIVFAEVKPAVAS